MSKEIAVTQPRSILDIIATAANDASIDPAKMSALLEMQIKILDNPIRIIYKTDETYINFFGNTVNKNTCY